MNCNNFNSTHQCTPKYPPYDITNGEDKLISKCSMKSTKSSDLKKAFDTVDNYSRINMFEIEKLLN